MYLYKDVRINIHKLIIIIICFEILIIFYQKNEYYESLNLKNLKQIFKEKSKINIFNKIITQEFKLKKYVNLNEIESKLPFGNKWNSNIYNLNEINVGVSLDPNFILKAIITISSVISSQKSNTKLRLHFSVVNNFKSKDMLKIYSLRYRLREDVEFNFYDASRVEKDLYSISRKGPGLSAKLLLPQLVRDNVKKLILIDIGDVLVLRDLTKMYNWNMKNNIYMGAPDTGAGIYGKISKKNLKVYINVGHYLIDVEKVKKRNMYQLFVKYKNIYKSIYAEQLMINDIAYGFVDYLPIEYGLVPPFKDDKFFKIRKNRKKSIYECYNLTVISGMSNTLNSLPTTYEEFPYHAFNPVIVHSWNGKWAEGNGMNIYRRLCQYFIELSGMKKEICSKYPGYCIKI